ncbi:NACHT domain-containing protein [Stackebrandtia nassauensis]|uniref:Putative signal transduction protein with Nacht domain n=1 Tax=Stackebrandtia nassauensis (strain DSM 44728 / CIP 108903 / NRRL B-16338 / NBRC 102104 / LLR-40K-21) TaxID=446470 RepID=D3Q668_STANL|nr:NACHT domain-containing protein [Stackebrandtia nassauensis]ADD42243.1 putative signal transduction protein with Nacht domain [Stackebrandtia nassauensis DSM 44728]
MSDDPPTSKAATTIGALVALVPAGVITIRQAWSLVAGNPLWFAAIVLGSVLLGFAARVIAKAIAETENRLASALRGRIISVWPTFRARYARKLSAHCQRRPLHGVKTLDPFGPILQDVYVEVSLDQQWMKKHSGKLRASWETDEPRPLEYFLRNDEANIFTVTGAAGSGKTSMLRRTAFRQCQRQPWLPRRVPVLLYLREHLEEIKAAPTAYSLLDAARQQPWARDLPPEWIRRKLERGRCLVLLDGVDEIVGEADRFTVMEWIGRQIEIFEGNDFVVTSRPHGFDDGNLEGHVRLQLLPFTVETILRFLRGWFLQMEKRSSQEGTADVAEQADKEYRDLKAQFDRRRELYDLASRPLLLTMIANVHKYNRELPGSRAELYQEMCDMLLRRRQVKGSSAEWSISIQQQRELLGRLALSMTRGKRTELSFHDAAKTIEEAQRDYPGEVVADDFLRDLVHDGLLVPDLNDSYSFPHSTFREYLTASVLSHDRPDDVALLVEHVDDPAWREVLSLWCASSDASPIVAACLDSMTGHAIDLAYECAEVAHRLSRELTQRLRQLERPGNTDADGLPVHLLTKVRRSCDDLIPVDESASICRVPFSHELIRLHWEASERERGQLLAPEFKRGTPADSDPAHGLWERDATGLVAWADDFYGDERHYRLPSVWELEALYARDSGLIQQPVWARDDEEIRLFCPEGIDSPFTLDNVRFAASVLEDRWDSPVYLLIALAYLRAARKDTLSTGNTFANDFDHTINFEHAYTIARAYDKGTDPDRPLEDALRYALIKVRQGVSSRVIVDPDAPESPGLRRIETTDRVRLFRRHGGMHRTPARHDHTLIRAYSLFLTPWMTAPDEVPGALASFDIFLMGLTTDDSDDVPLYPGRLGPMLDRAQEAVAREPADDHATLGAVSRRVVRDVRADLTPMLERREPYDNAKARAARLGLLAASAAATFMDEPDTAALLRSCARGVAVLHARITGDIAPTEVIRPACVRAVPALED